jgi:nucleotide-binding universal stress UspA family protein
MLLPIDKILCPTDFSDPSYDALKNACELCSHFGATLCLLHIVPAMPRPAWAAQLEDDRNRYEPSLSEYEDALYDRAQQKLYAVIKERIPKEVKSCALVGRGDAANEIVRMAEDERAGLIVIATHGLTGWRQVAFGSVTERVGRLSNRPVLTIRIAREKF